MTSVDIKLKYVAPERMASGNIRYRFQRGGIKKTIRGKPGSKEFYAHYSSLLDGTNYEPQRAPVIRFSVSWLVGLFLRDLEERVNAGLASPLTLKGHRHHLGRLVEKHGTYPVKIPRKNMVRFLDKYKSTPGARDNLRKSISALYEWGFDKEHIDASEMENPTKRIKRINKKSKGFYTCTYNDVRKFLEHHGPGTRARRVVVLTLFTAARREDLRLLGPFNRFTRNGQPWLRWTQSKAPHGVVEIPMLPALVDEVKAVRDGTFIQTATGKPMTNGTLGNYVRKWFDDAGVPGSLHGLRKGISSILTGLGATGYELDVLLGHELGSEETQVYIESARRIEIADGLRAKMANVKL